MNSFWVELLGASVYQLRSPTYRKGCVSTASLHCNGEVISVLPPLDLVAADAGTAPTASAAAQAATAPRKRGGRIMYGISGTSLSLSLTGTVGRSAAGRST